MSASGRKRQRLRRRQAQPAWRACFPRMQTGLCSRAPGKPRAFAIVVLLYQQGHFTWEGWVKALSTEIVAAKAAGRTDYGSAYYELWLTAAEKLLTAKGMFLEQELRHKKTALTTAYT